MKTTVYLTLVLLLLTASAFAQGRLSVGVTAAPVLSHGSSRFTINLPDQNGQIDPQTLDFRSTTGGFVVGVPVRYSFTPKWSVTSGLWFNQLRTTGSFPFVSGNVPARIITSAFKLPLTVDYRPTTRRLSPYFSVGAVGSFRGSTLYKPTKAGGFSDTKVTFGRHALTVQALLGAGVAYQINPHWSLTIQPLLIWTFRPSGNYERFVSYQVNGQTQLLYSF